MFPLHFPKPGRVYIPAPHAPRIKSRFKIRFVNRGYKVMDYAMKWRKTFLYRCGGSIRQSIIRAFYRKKRISSGAWKGRKPRTGAGVTKTGSPIGTAPFTWLPKTKFLRAAIHFAVDAARGVVMVGTRYSVCQLWGWKHEFGKRFRGANFPKRPMMGPPFREWLRQGRYKVSRHNIEQIMRESRQSAYKL